MLTQAVVCGCRRLTVRTELQAWPQPVPWVMNSVIHREVQWFLLIKIFSIDQHKVSGVESTLKMAVVHRDPVLVPTRLMFPIVGIVDIVHLWPYNARKCVVASGVTPENKLLNSRLCSLFCTKYNISATSFNVVRTCLSPKKTHSLVLGRGVPVCLLPFLPLGSKVLGLTWMSCWAYVAWKLKVS